jgi:DNA replication protein DnaC
MLLEQTIQKLHELRLHGMSNALQEQLQNPESAHLSFEERLSMLVDSQYTWKENRALSNRIKKAGFKLNACPEDINYHLPRGIQKALLAPLFLSNWIEKNQNCIITGPTGVGKTYLACAIGQKACRNGFSAQYFFLPKLFRALEQATAEGTLNHYLNTLSKIDLLIVDEWGMDNLKDHQLKEFLEILDDRHESHSTILTSQFPVKNWHDAMGNPTIADAILDRLIHNCLKIELSGESMRKIKSKEKGDKKL